MADYTQNTNFAAKDALNTGDAEKIILGADFDGEFSEIAARSADKEDTSNKGASSGYAQLDSGTLLPVALLPAATTDAVGVLEIATDSEATTGTATDKWLTPANLDAVIELMGGVGLTESGRVLTFDANELSTATPVLGDEVVFADGGTTSKLATFTVLNGIFTLANLSDYDANDHIDHTAVSVVAGAGMTGGGTIAANRTLNCIAGIGITVNANDIDFDPSGLTALTIGNLDQAADGFVVSNNGVANLMAYDEMGVKVASQDAIQTFAVTDANTLQVLTGSTNRVWTIPANGSVPFQIGTIIICQNSGTGDLLITAASGVIIDSIFHAAGATAQSDRVLDGGRAALIKTATDTWSLAGNLADS